MAAAGVGAGGFDPPASSVRAEAPVLQLAERPDVDVVPVGEADFDRLGNSAEAKAARRDRERLKRRLVDEELIQGFVRDKLASPTYMLFEMELIRYGAHVLQAWMCTGHIFTVASLRGMGLNATDWEREALRRDPSARETIANYTIAATMRSFRKRALLDGGWRATGGASILTYFVGALIYSFSNAYRSWQREERRWTDCQVAELKPPRQPSSDPLAQLVDDEKARRLLAKFDERQRMIVQLVADGLSQKEIAARLQLESPRAVEGVLRRLRAQLKKEGQA